MPTGATTIGSGSTDVRAFYQGVEISDQSTYDAGLVKVWSGEPGHQLRQTWFGESRTFHTGSAYVEYDGPDVNAVFNLNSRSPVKILTSPITTQAPDRQEGPGFALDGTIEPLTIRYRATYVASASPLDPHILKATLASGNENRIDASDRVLTVNRFTSNVSRPFLDSTVLFFSASLNPGFNPNNSVSAKSPFADIRYIGNSVTSSGGGSTMDAALSLMTGSTDNYIRFDQVSVPCGWTYDSVSGVGTDSLAFGGKTY